MPATLFDAVLPGSSLLANFLLTFGVDAPLLFSWIAILAAAWAAVRYGFVAVTDSTVKAFSSFVIVEEYDPIYQHVLSWASARKNLQDIRSLRAQTAGQYYESFSDDEEEDDTHQLQLRESMSEDMIFNFNSWSARAPPLYRPHQSSGWFFHNYRLIRLRRTRDRVSSEMGLVYEQERLEIYVLWPSPKPIKQLIEEAREFVLARRTSTTTIKRPTTKSQRSGRHQAWTTIANRPSRSMATVVLDNEQKRSVLKDFNEFLHPKTARWYSNRGIPYRRGYLFHGPPGTGKTSLSFALAGVFGLDIYSLALSEASLTEEDLILLFNSLPKRCILLLEDVDTAGLGRAPGSQVASKPVTSKTSSPSNGKNTRITPIAANREEGHVPASPRVYTPDVPTTTAKEPTFKNTITLSGLLNAVDGVASQEGRVLIMTTNHPERLDQALTRPGRVDLTIKFDFANRQQIKDLFLRMYTVDTLDMTRQPTKISHILPNQEELDNLIGQISNSAPGDNKASGLASTDISKLAQEFANALPSLTFSPAEIQGFLLGRKKDPKQALGDVFTWRDEQLQSKSNSMTMSTSNGKIMSKAVEASSGEEVSVPNGDGQPKCQHLGTINVGMQPAGEAVNGIRSNGHGADHEVESGDDSKQSPTNFDNEKRNDNDDNDTGEPDGENEDESQDSSDDESTHAHDSEPENQDDSDEPASSSDDEGNDDDSPLAGRAFNNPRFSPSHGRFRGGFS